MIFKYEIKTNKNNETNDLWDISDEFVCATEPIQEEQIKFEIDETSKTVSVVGNKAGWEYLAKVCVEMSFCADHDPTFHIHRKADMSFSDSADQDVVSFFIEEKKNL